MSAAEPGAGVLLVGRSGSGKTSVQRRLVEEHGFWAPLHVTTRPVHESDFASEHRDADEFFAAVSSGELTGPMLFGACWHAWSRADFERLCRGDGRGVAICRPYEALLLHAVQPRLVPVWLDAPATVLAERRRARGALRDVDAVHGSARGADDDEDELYRPLFTDVVSTERNAVAAVLRLLDGAA